MNKKCEGWTLGDSGYSIDPCDYEEIGKWESDSEKKVYEFVRCRVCGFINQSWVKKE